MGRAVDQKHLYFLRAASVGLIKIGCSREPEQRLITLHRVSPVPLDLVLRVPGTHDDERHLHFTFRDDRSHLEWFRASPRLEALINRLRSGCPVSDVTGESMQSMIRSGTSLAEIGRRMGVSRQRVHQVKIRMDVAA